MYTERQWLNNASLTKIIRLTGFNIEAHMNEHEHFNSQQSSSTLHTFTICTTNSPDVHIFFAHAKVMSSLLIGTIHGRL